VNVFLVNPSDLSFGIGVVAPRWLYVLASATPRHYGDPRITDESLEPFDLSQVRAGDVVGVGIHTTNALRGYEVGREARKRGAWVVFGGIHAGLYPDEAERLGGAHAVVRGDGDVVWKTVLEDCAAGRPKSFYSGGHVEPGEFLPARWDLLPSDRYMWASVQTLRGCPKHCSFCSVWKTDGQRPRQRGVEPVMQELVELRRQGFRFVVLADDNFYPVPLRDLEVAGRRENKERRDALAAIRQERFDLMEAMAELPEDMVFFTQITMEAAEDPDFLAAMRRARIRGALVGIESVTAEGLKSVYKDFNLSGSDLVARLRQFRENGIYILGSFIFGLPTDRPDTFGATVELATSAELAFAQFVTLNVFPGTLDFHRWEQQHADQEPVNGFPRTRYWLLPRAQRPRLPVPHPTMSEEEIRRRTQAAWDDFYSIPSIWKRSRCVSRLKPRLAFLLISKLYRQMYANTGISTDSARISRAATWARWIARPCRRLFKAPRKPDLRMPMLRTAETPESA
jgi:radical SAM superfamily enzyme YgiQ (UPF0313 family)